MDVGLLAKRLRGKAMPLALAIIAVLIILSLDTLEDILIEGGTFSGAPLDLLLNAIVKLTQDATATVSSWGYVGVFSLMLLESSSLPVPSEVVLPFAGYLVSLGQLDLWATVVASTLAGITGSLIDYYIGMNGMGVLNRHKALERLLINRTNLERAERWFKKNGALVVFLSRMVPAFRALVSFPAGAVKMSLPKFTACTLAGCLVWNALLVYIGMYAGANWREVAGISYHIIIVSLVAIIAAFFILLIRRMRLTPKGRPPPSQSIS